MENEAKAAAAYEEAKAVGSFGTSKGSPSYLCVDC